MSWPFDTTTPHVTPEDLLACHCGREGYEREQLALPPVMVATFQRASYARLVEETVAGLPRGLQDRRVAGGTGASGIESLLIGRLPRSQRPVAVTRFGVGAPATVLTLEVALARGVRTVLVCGSAGSLQPLLPLGSLVVVTESEQEHGTSHHYLPAGEIVSADPVVTEGLTRTAQELGLSPTEGRSWTIDAPFRETAGAIARHRAAGVVVVEMEAGARRFRRLV
jgi:nucleoside phosphorylase